MKDSVVTFYDQLADSYHLIYADWRNQGVPRQGEALDQVIREKMGPPPTTVLDCSCGIGTQAIGLALRGYMVRGTDISPKAIQRARREAITFGVDADFAVADFRLLEHQVEGRFDVVLSCDNSLPHLTDDQDILLALRNMHSKVRPGGLLLIGIRDYDQLAQSKPRATTPQVADSPDGRRITFQVWDWSDDGRSYTLHLFVIGQDEGQAEARVMVTRYRALLRAELSRLLDAAGFTGIRWHLPSETGYFQPLVTARRRQKEQEARQPTTAFQAWVDHLVGDVYGRTAACALLACTLLMGGTAAFVAQTLLGNVDARPGFAAVCTVIPLVTLLLMARSARKGDQGASRAWAWFALPFPVLLILITLPFVHVSTSLKLTRCDPTMTTCGEPVLGFRIALALFVASTITMIIGVRALSDMG